MSDFASIKRDARGTAIRLGLTPPPRLSLSAWANEHFRLSAENSAQPGRWTCIPYQTAILDAITDPSVTQVSLMKSARVGYTLMMSAAVGYYMHQAPCPILLVQPTVDDAKGFSKETIAPMLRDVPVLSKIVFEDAEEVGPRDSANTILHKRFPGGVLSMVGANSGAGFRRVSRKVVAFDECDAYPASAGSDGDPIKLGMKRTEYYWDRKIIAGSTPLIEGHSRIAKLFEEGDQRHYYVPCPQCGHMDYLVFTERESGGHFMEWPEGSPADAHFVCSKNGCVIEHKDKRSMIERGEWRAARPFSGHASFHISALYSYSPNSSWGQIAQEFLEAKRGGQETLRVFVNTALAETWKETGEAPEWERLYHRREQYQIGTVPEPVKFLTAGVDVQKDRFVYEVVAWAANKESWSVEAGVLPGDTAREESWLVLDELLGRQYSTPTGAMGIRMLGIDSGYNTQQVYNWGRRHERNRVVAIKGSDHAMTIISTPTKVDVHHSGRRIARGYSVWPIGVSITKSELYGFLRLNIPEGDQPYPAGFCHFPEYDQEYFKQLTSEQLVTTKNAKTGRQVLEWHVIPGRENHWLDARVYARAVSAIVGLDRMLAPAPAVSPAAPIPTMSDSNRLTKKPKQSNAWVSRNNWFRK